MMLTQRSYSGESDHWDMIQLARELQEDNLHVIDLPYRLSSWALDESDNVGLWVDEHGRLVAWAVMQTPFWTIDYELRTDAGDDLHMQILRWADQGAQETISTPYGHPAWFVNVFADQMDRSQVVEQSRYVSQAEVGED